MEEKEIEKIEQEISNLIKSEVASLSWKEKKKRICEEVKKRNYLVEDWQVHYAVDRIKEMLNSTDLRTRNHEKLSKKMLALTILIMVVSFFVMIASLNIDSQVLRSGLIFASFASIVYSIKILWKSFTFNKRL